MADDTETKNDVADENAEYEYEEGPNSDDNPTQAVDSNNAVESTTVVPSPQPPSDVDNNADAAPAADSVAPVEDNYEGDYDDDEPLPDVTVKLYINELPEGAVTDAINTFTDEYGNPVGGWSKAIEDYTSTIAQDLLDGNGTATGKQGWLGSWTWSKSLLVGLIALCIIGIIIALVCLVIGKRSKRNNSAQRSGSGTTSTAKAVVTKGVNPDTKYAAVPTDV